MTISDYLIEVGAVEAAATAQPGNEYQQFILSKYHVWNNNSCEGYCIKAMQQAGVSKAIITKVLAQFAPVFDSMTVDEARLLSYEYK